MQIDMELRLLDGRGCTIPNVYMSVDGTDCPIREPEPFSTQWYSHKMNGAGLRYEVAVSVNGGDIVWVAGPYPCGAYPDLRIYRDQLKRRLLPTEKVIADNGYRDPTALLQSEAGEFESFHRMVRARHEGVNGRLKRFKILTTPFRHGRDLHAMCFYAVANVTNLTITFEEPLFPLV